MNCYCGHSIDWDHYKRTPGNGQKFDDVCVGCLLLAPDHSTDPWHKPEKEKESDTENAH